MTVAKGTMLQLEMDAWRWEDISSELHKYVCMFVLTYIPLFNHVSNHKIIGNGFQLVFNTSKLSNCLPLSKYAIFQFIPVVLSGPVHLRWSPTSLPC